jgi:hypothetical protein
VRKFEEHVLRTKRGGRGVGGVAEALGPGRWEEGGEWGGGGVGKGG